MKTNAFVRVTVALLVIFCLFVAPTVSIAAAKKGEKNFKAGLRHEIAEQWDRAAEEFALALAASPGNAEYRLHYRRALFNASQMMMQRGRTFSEQKDYVSAYNAFRQAYGYDPTNELAKAEMERMMRLQAEKDNPATPEQNKVLPQNTPPTTSTGGVKLIPTAYTATGAQIPQTQQDTTQQIEELRNINYANVDLKKAIKDLSTSLGLNVLFDTETFRSERKVAIELKDVTTAQALDAIFLQEGLFFQKVGKRMILVASQNRRSNFQQLVLRTFYLANANPESVRTVLQQAIPAQPGRPPTIPIIDKDTNSITVRDTTENIKIIANLIKALDKDRAEVVMDVNIYEVSKDDLLNFGVQVGTSDSLNNLGGSTSGVVGLGGTDNFGTRTNSTGGTVGLLNRSIGAGLILPAVQLQAFQSKDNTKLLASTQVHAFNGEESQTRIGRRVPVRTAQLFNVNNNLGGNNNTSNPAEVINYEQVGLTLKFTPQVFPNQDVQVKMSIESKDVTGAASLTPIFSERSISGTARIQNNRTLMLASVAQDTESRGRSGLPLLSALPILGRLFSAPRRTNSQVDIVIAVTPRVLRAPTILPEDLEERETGSIATPTNSSLADMIRREDAEDQLIAARRLTNNNALQLPDQKPEEAAAPTYVQTKDATTNVSQNTLQNVGATSLKPIDSAAIKTLTITPTAENFDGESKIVKPIDTTANLIAAGMSAPEINFSALGNMRKGETRRVVLIVNATDAFQMANLAFTFDAVRLKIKSISRGDIFGSDLTQTVISPTTNADGKFAASLPAAATLMPKGAGVLAYVEIEALADGLADLQIDRAATKFIGENGAISAVR